MYAFFFSTLVEPSAAPVVVLTIVPSGASSVLVVVPSPLSTMTIFGMIDVSFSPHTEQVRSLRPSSFSVASLTTVHSDHLWPSAGIVSVLVSPQEHL